MKVRKKYRKKVLEMHINLLGAQSFSNFLNMAGFIQKF